MTAKLLDWDSAPEIIDSPSFRIWYKQVWSDAWTEDTRLRCNQISWTIGGSGYSTATLHLDLGVVFHDATRSLETRTEVNLRGYYICIMVAGNDATEPYNVGGSPSGNPYTTPNRFWLGYVESQVLRDDGVTDGVKTGEQTFFCFTLDRALMHHPIIESKWRNVADIETTSAIDFNFDGNDETKNMSANPVGGTRIFDPDPSVAWPWNTRDIVSYLIKQTPRDESDALTIEFKISGATNLPNYDSPRLQSYGRDTASLINDLVRPGRMLGWVFQPVITLSSGAPSVGDLNVKCFTLAESQVAIGSETLPANDKQFQINAASDPLTEYTFENNGLDTAQQVIVHGAKRITIATLTLDTNAPLIPGWEAADATEYNEGKSNEADYANQDQETQRRWNAEVRGSAKLRHVFSRFFLNKDWDGADVFNLAKQQSDIGGAADADYRPYFRSLRLLSRLPLIVGKDYDGDPAGNTIQAFGEATQANDREPLLIFEAPWDAAKYVDSSVLGKAAHLQGTRDGDDADFSVNVGILADDRTLELNVSGGDPHEIAYADFVRLEADPEDEALSKYDFRKAKLTIAIEEDRYLEIKEPEEFDSVGVADYDNTAAYSGPTPGPASRVKYQGRVYDAKQNISAPAGNFDATKWEIASVVLDAVRKKLIRAGDTYQSIFVADDTATAVKADGTLMEMSKGFLVDDYSKLEKIAKLAAVWYTKPRSELRLTTARITGEILPGSLITSVAGKSVNTVVSSVTIDLPPGGSATMQITTWYGDIDPVGLLQDSGVV